MADDKDGKLQLKLRAFQTAEALVRQLIWLSTGTIALSVTLLTGWSNSGGFKGTCFLVAAWIALGFSLVVGLYVLGALAHELNRKAPENLNIYASNIKGPALSQEIIFVLGIVLLLIFAIVNLK